MIRKSAKSMPQPVTLNDCCLLWQMGYEVHINDGRVSEVVKRKDFKKPGGRK